LAKQLPQISTIISTFYENGLELDDVKNLFSSSTPQNPFDLSEVQKVNIELEILENQIREESNAKVSFLKYIICQFHG
jgi:hypothetical protein